MKEKSGAFYTGHYHNVFEEAGYIKSEISERLEHIFQTIFYGSKEECFYHRAGKDMGYMEDTGNHDVRTEGMSYGMMVCVQMDKKEEFDRLWKWTKTYMYMDSGENAGYFAWSCRTDGTKNAYGPAPDGEEFFAMALLFASNRWGDGKGIFEYAKEAKAILHECVHKGENAESGRAMWDPSNYLIRFVTNEDFSDPSYHLPHFYELFSRWGNEEDSKFWERAALASREYFKKACHPVTGLSAEYAEFDGTPHVCEDGRYGGRHDWYYSDAYRTVANAALDYEWFGAEEEEALIADRLQVFFCKTVKDQPHNVYLIDGTILDMPALHPVAMTAVNAQASLASHGSCRLECVQKFWNTSLREGDRRYYDNFLYLFAFLSLSGHYRVWKKTEE